MKIIVCAILVAVLTGTLAQTQIFNNADLRSGSSPGGTACGHSESYDFTGNSRGSFYVGFSTAGLNAPVLSAEFFIKPARCVNANRITFNVRTLQDPSATFNEEGGINDQCPFLEAKDTFEAMIEDQNCISQGIDVTSALNAALDAGNSQFVLSLFDLTKSDAENPNFCNRFINPDVDPFYNEQTNCGVEIISGESLYIVVESSTAVPSTTVAPTTAEPTCPECPCGSHSGKRRNGCPICKECTTEPPVQATCPPCPCGSQPGKRRNGCAVCLECTTTAAPTTEPPVEATCPPCPCGSVAGKRRNGCAVCLECTTTAAPTTEPPVEATCPPCPCGSHAGKRRNGCPVCLECTTTEPPVQATCPPCPCGSHAGKRRNGCPICLECTTTEPPVQATCPPCPCGSHAGKRRNGCPICLECTTTEPPVQATCPPCPCGSQPGKRRSGCAVCLPCTTKAPTTEPPVQGTTATPSETAQIAGDNNARANSGVRAVVAGSTLIVAAVAMLW